LCHGPTWCISASKAKLDAVIAQAAREHRRGRPVVIGEQDPVIAAEIVRRLKIHPDFQDGVGEILGPLDARTEDREREYVAKALRKGYALVTTKITGRGTDFLLGGDPEVLAELDAIKETITTMGRARRPEGEPDPEWDQKFGFFYGQKYDVYKEICKKEKRPCSP